MHRVSHVVVVVAVAAIAIVVIVIKSMAISQRLLA
jgi:hypothetical protein